MEVHANSSVSSAAEYKTLCPGGEGFRPNPITVILEGNCPLSSRSYSHTSSGIV